MAIFERSLLDGPGLSDFKVGESTVEIGSHYLIKRQGLSRYLYEHQLPKNGLRYFFDSPGHDAALPTMSEVGTTSLPFLPAFQVDRSRFDRDVLEMNAASGVELRMGAQVTGIEFAEGDAPHHLRVAGGGDSGTEERVACRWLIDATGRASLVARQRGLRVPEPEHRIQAVWGRFEGVRDADGLGDEAFRERVRHTPRGLSTIHFCYADYWIWVIPLRQGVTSIGFVGNPPPAARGLNTEAGFRDFLVGHRALRELLADAKPLDVAHFRNLAYGTKQFLSRERWGLTGEAASFADPLYSPGADFIALENDFLADLIARDLGGEAGEDWGKRAELYDAFLRFRHEAAMRLYRGQYPGLGSYEWMRLKWDFDLGCYYNLWVSPYMRDQHLDARYLKRQVRQQRFVLQALANYGDFFRTLFAHLRDEGSYSRANLGRFSHGLENIDFVEQVGTDRPERAVLEKTGEIFNQVRADGLRLLGREPDGPRPLTTLMTPRPIA